MSFKAVLADVDLLKNTIPIISEIIDEGVFNIDKDGITLLAPDRTMVSVVDFKLLSSAFEEFQVSESTTLGLNMANLTSVLKRAKSSDKIEFTPADGKLVVRILGSSTRKFEIPLIDVRAEKPPVDQLSFNTKLELNAGVIQEGIDDAEIIGDSVYFHAEGDTFRMFAKGDISSASLEIKKGQDGLLSIITPESVKAQYPLDYLKKMIKISKLSPTVTAEFGADYPLRLNFTVVDKMQIRFVLAP
ncbi:MAG: proliferating cell nuclear antigen (pcna), partial [Candidatus Aenigmatarchaeota archaeon]